jgi:type I restriction-modification system DNA methylase subunit/predicted type IV restriction endonuclease
MLMAVPKVVRGLVARYKDNEQSYRRDYGETETRREFIDPLFKALGWDIDNSAGHAEAYKDVVHEDAVKIGAATKAPDYSFRIGGTRKFFLEAKRPAVDIHTSADPAFQLRRYAWSAKLPLSVLTNFAEFSIYDCRVKPSQGDKSSVARVLYVTYEDYESRWTEIEQILSKEAVLKGSFDKYATEKGKRGTAEVDEAFLLEIESWRESLAKNIALRNSLDTQELNYAVQQTIDRIVFLRICEDRGIEQYGRLRQLLNGDHTYARLKEIYRYADDRYNSGLFHFRSESGRGAPDALTLDLKLDDKALKDILRHLYYPESPYEFSVLPADILGQVYEQFLGKVIRLTGGGQAKVDEKPDVKKAGGVYYTPTHVVEYIVASTLRPLLVKCNPKQMSGLRVLDPACGSGSFLIGAYQYLLEWLLNWYVNNSPAKHAKGKNPAIYQGPGGMWKLTTGERKRILLENIYGVDVDPQAVEVTKLSLLLKVLEGESEETLGRNFEMFHQRALPDLDQNVKCGNSLVGPDYFSSRFDFGDEEDSRVNPFDWEKEFNSITKAGGFDAVIGNPPYVDSEWMTKTRPEQRQYCSQRYAAASGNWDLFCVFIEKAVGLTRANGKTSFIVPNKLASANYAEGARRVLTSSNRLVSIRDYSSVPVFPVAVYPMVFVSEKSPAKANHKVKFEKMGTGGAEGAVVLRNANLDHKDYFSKPDHGWSVFGDLDGRAIVDVLRRKFKRFDQMATILGAATVSEAYEIGPLLVNKKAGSALRFVNSGTIDRFHFAWGEHECRYLKRTYLHPRISADSLEEVSEKRLHQAQTPKLVIAGMTKVLECAIDSNGEFVAGKSTTVVFAKKHLSYFAAVLNSRLMSFVYEVMFGGDKLAGGYLRVGPPQLSVLPIPDPEKAGQPEKIESLVTRLVRLNDQAATASLPQRRAQLTRQIDALESEIDKLVCQIYELTPQQISVIAKSTGE